MTAAFTACSVRGEGVPIWQPDPGKPRLWGTQSRQSVREAGNEVRAAQRGLNPKATAAQVAVLLKAGVHRTTEWLRLVGTPQITHPPGGRTPWLLPAQAAHSPSVARGTSGMGRHSSAQQC